MANNSRALSGEFTASRYPHLLYILVGTVPVTRNRGHLEKSRQLRSATLRNRSSGSSCITHSDVDTAWTVPSLVEVFWWQCIWRQTRPETPITTTEAARAPNPAARRYGEPRSPERQQQLVRICALIGG